MVIFKRTQGPVGNIISGGKGPAIPSPLQNREINRVKANTGLTKVVINLNKLRRRLKPSGRLYPLLLRVYKLRVGLWLISSAYIYFGQGGGKKKEEEGGKEGKKEEKGKKKGVKGKAGEVLREGEENKGKDKEKGKGGGGGGE